MDQENVSQIWVKHLAKWERKIFNSFKIQRHHPVVLMWHPNTCLLDRREFFIKKNYSQIKEKIWFCLKSAQYKKLAPNALRFHIRIWNLANHMKKQSKKHWNARFVDEKLKTKSLMLFVSFFPCDLQNFKFQYVNRKEFGTSFLYWVDFI